MKSDEVMIPYENGPWGQWLLRNGIFGDTDKPTERQPSEGWKHKQRHSYMPRKAEECRKPKVAKQNPSPEPREEHGPDQPVDPGVASRSARQYVSLAGSNLCQPICVWITPLVPVELTFLTFCLTWERNENLTLFLFFLATTPAKASHHSNSSAVFWNA